MRIKEIIIIAIIIIIVIIIIIIIIIIMMIKELALGEDENTNALKNVARRMTATFLNCKKTCE